MSKQETGKGGGIIQAIERRKEWFENQTPPCPEDGSPGKFVNYAGSYTRVRGKFKCEKEGHEFYYG